MLARFVEEDGKLLAVIDPFAISVPLGAPLQVNEEEWQRLVEMIRQSEPRFPTLDEAMNFSRGRP